MQRYLLTFLLCICIGTSSILEAVQAKTQQKTQSKQSKIALWTGIAITALGITGFFAWYFLSKRNDKIDQHELSYEEIKHIVAKTAERTNKTLEESAAVRKEAEESMQDAKIALQEDEECAEEYEAYLKATSIQNLFDIVEQREKANPALYAKYGKRMHGYLEVAINRKAQAAAGTATEQELKDIEQSFVNHKLNISDTTQNSIKMRKRKLELDKRKQAKQ